LIVPIVGDITPGMPKEHVLHVHETIYKSDYKEKTNISKLAPFCSS
jgi:hypothetical protein